MTTLINRFLNIITAALLADTSTGLWLIALCLVTWTSIIKS